MAAMRRSSAALTLAALLYVAWGGTPSFAQTETPRFGPALSAQSEMEPGTFSVSVSDENGRLYPPSGESFIDPESGETITPLPRLLAGDYVVRYEDEDGRTLEQTFSVGGRSMIPRYPDAESPRAALPVIGVGVAALALAALSYRRRRPLLLLPGLAAGLTATVLLVGGGSEAPRPGLECGVQADSGDFESLRACLVKAGSQLLPAGVMAVDEFLQDIEAEPVIAAWEGENVCHEVAHDLGKMVAYADPGLAVTLQDLPETCDLGLLHGAVEAAGILLADADLLQVAAEVCRSVSERNRTDCTHGLGHAGGTRAGYDFEKALEFCMPLLPGIRSAGECVAAAGMSITELPPIEGRHVEHLRADPPSTHWENLHEACLGLSEVEDALVGYCLRGIVIRMSRAGASSAGHGVLRSPSFFLSWCSSGEIPANLEASCVHAAGAGYIYAPDPSAEELFESCGRLDEALRARCLDGGFAAAGQLQSDPATNRVLLDICSTVVGGGGPQDCLDESLRRS